MDAAQARQFLRNMNLFPPAERLELAKTIDAAVFVDLLNGHSVDTELVVELMTDCPELIDPLGLDDRTESTEAIWRVLCELYRSERISNDDGLIKMTGWAANILATGAVRRLDDLIGRNPTADRTLKRLTGRFYQQSHQTRLYRRAVEALCRHRTELAWACMADLLSWRLDLESFGSVCLALASHADTKHLSRLVDRLDGRILLGPFKRIRHRVVQALAERPGQATTRWLIERAAFYNRQLAKDVLMVRETGETVAILSGYVLNQADDNNQEDPKLARLASETLTRRGLGNQLRRAVMTQLRQMGQPDDRPSQEKPQADERPSQTTVPAAADASQATSSADLHPSDQKPPLTLPLRDWSRVDELVGRRVLWNHRSSERGLIGVVDKVSEYGWVRVSFNPDRPEYTLPMAVGLPDVVNGDCVMELMSEGWSTQGQVDPRYPDGHRPNWLPNCPSKGGRTESETGRKDPLTLAADEK